METTQLPALVEVLLVFWWNEGKRRQIYSSGVY